VIISGLEITSAQLESAEEMLAQAGVSNTGRAGQQRWAGISIQ